MTRFIFALLSLAVLTAPHLQAQKANFTEGTVVYELKTQGIPQAEMYLNGSTLTYSFNDKNSNFDISVMKGLGRMQIISQSINKAMMLLDVPMLSERSAVEIDPENNEQLKTMREQASGENQGMELFKKKGSKTIAGQKCQRMGLRVIGQPIPEDMVIDIFLAPKLRPAGLETWSETAKVKNMNGMPLGFEVKYQGVTIQLLAKEINRQAPASSKFEIPKDYQVKTLEEFQNGLQEKMGGITPGGIGL